MQINASLLIHQVDEIQLLLHGLKLVESGQEVCKWRSKTSPDQTQAARHLRLYILQQIRENSRKKVKAYRETAETFAKDGELEIDRGAPVSTGADDGAYVQAWMWVSNDDVRHYKKANSH